MKRIKVNKREVTGSMNKKLVIIGASGHGKVAADFAEKMNTYEEIKFFDDKENT